MNNFNNKGVVNILKNVIKKAAFMTMDVASFIVEQGENIFNSTKDIPKNKKEKDSGRI